MLLSFTPYMVLLRKRILNYKVHFVIIHISWIVHSIIIYDAVYSLINFIIGWGTNINLELGKKATENVIMTCAFMQKILLDTIILIAIKAIGDWWDSGRRGRRCQSGEVTDDE